MRLYREWDYGILLQLKLMAFFIYIYGSVFAAKKTVRREVRRTVFLFFRMRLRLVRGAEHVHDLVLDHYLHIRARGARLCVFACDECGGENK